MATVGLYSAAGDKQGKVDLPDSFVVADPNGHAVYETVKNYLANQRQGTHKTKTRHEVSGQKSKMYRQKGTGRARAGSATSGVRVGGGRIHGPRPRDYSYEIPAKVRRLALKTALTDRAHGEHVHVIEDPALAAPKTQAMRAMLGKMGLGERRVLVVNGKSDRTLLLSCRNLTNAKCTHVGELNAYDVMHCEDVVFTRSGLKALEEVLGR